MQKKTHCSKFTCDVRENVSILFKNKSRKILCNTFIQVSEFLKIQLRYSREYTRYKITPLTIPYRFVEPRDATLFIRLSVNRKHFFRRQRSFDPIQQRLNYPTVHRLRFNLQTLGKPTTVIWSVAHQFYMKQYCKRFIPIFYDILSLQQTYLLDSVTFSNQYTTFWQ